MLVNSKYLNQIFHHFSHQSGRAVLKEKDQVVSVEAKIKPVAKGASYHKIEYLTTEEFDGVPK